MDQNYKSEEHRKRLEEFYEMIDKACAKHLAEVNQWVEDKERQRRAEKELKKYKKSP